MMNLESINQKFHDLEEVPFREFFILSLSLAILSLSVVTVLDPTYLMQNEDPIVTGAIVSIIALAFTGMYLTIFVGGIIGGILLTWFLLKAKERIYVKNGVLIGNSLSTNHEFLRKLASELHPILIGFIRGYNDPKFTELEQKDQREKKELRTENVELKKENKELRELILPHIARQNRSNFDFNHRLSKLEEKNNEKLQTIGDKAQSKNNAENTKLKKFRDLDE